MAKNYDDYVYIKDGTLMKRKSKDTYVIYPKVRKKDIFDAIEDFLQIYPEILNIRTIIFSSIKRVTGAKTCVHYKLPSTNPNVTYTLDDPFYKEMVSFITNSKSYQENLKKVQDKRLENANTKEQIKKAKSLEMDLDSFFIHTHLEAKRKRHLKR